VGLLKPDWQLEVAADTLGVARARRAESATDINAEMTEESLAAVANWCATSVNRRLATRFADQVDDTLWPHLRRVLTSCRYFTTIAGSECLSLVVANHGGLAAEYHYLCLLVGEATRLTAMRDLKPSPLDVEDWALRGLFVIVPRPAGSRWEYAS
jgi:hypothetical protein